MSHPRLRRRLRSDVSQSPFLYRHPVDGYSTLYTLTDEWQSFGVYSNIDDAVGTPITQRVKPCDHIMCTYRGLPMQDTTLDWGNLIKFGGVRGPHVDINAIYDGTFPSCPHSLRVQAAGRAFVAFSERFPAQISGAEFLQGALELKALMPKLERTITRTIASGYLNKKFGWDNLLSDLNTLSTSIQTIRNRMEFLKRTYGKPTKLYHRENSFHSVDSWTMTYEPVRGVGVRLDLESYRCDFTAGCSLTQYMSHIDDFIGWLRAIVIGLGLNNPLKAIWQTTRLSFVVDWFAGVSDHLARLATIQPGDEWNLDNVSSTVVWNARFKVTQVHNGLQGNSDHEIPLGHVSAKRYTRLRGLPVDLTVFTPSTCTPSQLVLLTAMAASK